VVHYILALVVLFFFHLQNGVKSFFTFSSSQRQFPWRVEDDNEVDCTVMSYHKHHIVGHIGGGEYFQEKTILMICLRDYKVGQTVVMLLRILIFKEKQNDNQKMKQTLGEYANEA
jgi:hypothetical protein